MTQAYIFDYGGTLDTGGCHWGKQIWHAYQEAGVPVGEEVFREAYVYGERTLGRNVIIQPDFTFRQTLEAKLRLQLSYMVEKKAIGEADAAGWCEKLLAMLYALTCRHTAHSREVLTTLRELWPLVLVSNFYGNIRTVLSEFGFDGLFCHVVESAVAGIRKPDPRIFTLAVEALALKAEEVVVVGDSMDKDIIPARQAGCHTVWLKGEPWGDIPADTGAAERIITDIQQLLYTTNTNKKR